MRIRYCPKCNKAGLKHEDSDGKCIDGLTVHEHYSLPSEHYHKFNWSMRWCPRCKEWVNPELSRNYDQHKVR